MRRFTAARIEVFDSAQITGQALGWQMRLWGNILLRRGFGRLGLIEFLPEAIDFFGQFLRPLGLIIQPFTQFLDILLRRSRFA